MLNGTAAGQHLRGLSFRRRLIRLRGTAGDDRQGQKYQREPLHRVPPTGSKLGIAVRFPHSTKGSASKELRWWILPRPSTSISGLCACPRPREFGTEDW